MRAAGTEADMRLLFKVVPGVEMELPGIAGGLVVK